MAQKTEHYRTGPLIVTFLMAKQKICQPSNNKPCTNMGLQAKAMRYTAVNSKRLKNTLQTGIEVPLGQSHLGFKQDSRQPSVARQ